MPAFLMRLRPLTAAVSTNGLSPLALHDDPALVSSDGYRALRCGSGLTHTPMLDRIERILVACNRWLLILLLLAMACIVFANVVLRYTTGDSIVWAEEVARHMMIWVTFLGAGLVLRFGGHVAIDNLHRAVGTRSAQIIRGIVVVSLALFFVVMTVTSSQYVYATRFQTTAATDIPISYIYGAMPVGFVLMLIHLLFIARGYIAAGSFAESDEMDADAAASI